jgi:hypothetical protein
VPGKEFATSDADGRDLGRRLLFGALAFYAALATVAYLPTLPLDGSHTQICTCGDTAQQVWFLAWVPFALTHGHSLFYSNWVLYPSGINLMDNTAMPLLGLIAVPITGLFGPITAYNLLLRAGFTLSAFAMFVVVKHLVRWWPAALAAGLLYGFSPFMVGQGLSHEFLVFAPIPPLVFGILVDVLGRAQMSARQAGLLMGVLYGAQLLIASETFAMMALFSVTGVALALCYRDARARVGHLLKTAAWAAGVCAVVIAYPVYFFFSGPRQVLGSPHPEQELSRWHGDLLGALLPTSLMRFAPTELLRIGSYLVHGNLQENGTYLGLPLVLITTVLGIAYRRRPVTAVASALAVLSYALSLGSRIFTARHPTGVPGPFTLLARIPVLQDIEPARFSLFTALFIAVVLGTGLDRLRFPAPAASAVAAPTRRAADVPIAEAPARSTGVPPGAAPPGTASALAGRFADRALTGRRRAVLAMVVGLVALIPLVPRWPYPASPAITPPFFTTSDIQRIPSGSIVVTFPYPAHASNEALAWQAEASDRFRMVGGSSFFVPGPGGRSVETYQPQLRPHGIDRAFMAAFAGPNPRGGSRSPLQCTLLRGIRTDIRRYHISTVLIDPSLGHDPALAVRYLTAATRHQPERVGGMLGWFHLAHWPSGSPQPRDGTARARQAERPESARSPFECKGPD